MGGGQLAAPAVQGGCGGSVVAVPFDGEFQEGDLVLAGDVGAAPDDAEGVRPGDLLSHVGGQGSGLAAGASCAALGSSSALAIVAVVAVFGWPGVPAVTPSAGRRLARARRRLFLRYFCTWFYGSVTQSAIFGYFSPGFGRGWPVRKWPDVGVAAGRSLAVQTSPDQLLHVALDGPDALPEAAGHGVEGHPARQVAGMDVPVFHAAGVNGGVPRCKAPGPSGRRAHVDARQPGQGRVRIPPWKQEDRGGLLGHPER